jgi:hypothetical protein
MRRMTRDEFGTRNRDRSAVDRMSIVTLFAIALYLGYELIVSHPV